jgi:hypothetical protein
VDNRDFFHTLKGLPALEAVAQTLFLDGTETGQKICRRVGWQFRTFDPVDIQQLIHNWTGKMALQSVGCQPGRRRAGVEVAFMSGVGKFFFPAGPQHSKQVVRFTTRSLYTE